MKFNSKRLKERRKKFRFTLEELASRCETSKSYIWELESGKIEPSGKKVFLIAQALDCAMELFYQDEKPEPQDKTPTFAEYVIKKRGGIFIGEFGTDVSEYIEKYLKGAKND